MKRNIYGDFTVYPEDYSQVIIEELKKNKHIKIEPNYDTAKGVVCEEDLQRAGFYFIYKFKCLIYIGYSNNSIHDRVGRFFAGIRGTERHDESHSAAYKYSKYFGSNCENLEIKYVEVDRWNLLCSVTMQDIESSLIYELKPKLNMEIYKNRDIISHEMELENVLSFETDN